MARARIGDSGRSPVPPTGGEDCWSADSDSETDNGRNPTDAARSAQGNRRDSSPRVACHAAVFARARRRASLLRPRRRCAIHGPLRPAVRAQLPGRRTPKSAAAGRCPADPSERRTMPNPSDFDPLRLRLAGDDDDDDEKEGQAPGADKPLPVPSPYEKALLEARTLLISGPVDDKMLRDATVRVLTME